MARRHWLDPLARRLLIASGQLPASPRSSARGSRPRGAQQAGSSRGTTGADDEQDRIEQDLLKQKLASDPGLRLRDAQEVRHAAALGWRLDVNRATAADWRRLPGCTSAQVDLLLRLQAGGIQLSGPEDLRQVLAIREEQLLLWQPLLVFRWYDAPPASMPGAPIPVNQAGTSQLETLPGLSPERRRRLLRERARQPFRDLADLQLRLQFPPTVVEQWIGRVSFEPGPAGPVLPPGSRTRP
jgi:DNA uptake protein ComE-like DNA-binding protein